MNILTLDFETYWSQTHSLSKMSPITYVMHPDTEIISCSMKVNDYNTDVFFGEADIRKAFASLSIGEYALLGHNMSGFDAMICAWRFGLKPRMWMCTLAMARPLHGNASSVSLGALVERYGLGVKDNAALLQTKGKHLADFTPAELQAMREYNRADTDQCWALFRQLRAKTPARELFLIDATIRMLVEPKFQLDAQLLQTALVMERRRKQRAIAALADLLGVGVDEGGDPDRTMASVTDELMSAPKFKALLESLGVEVPTKPSPSDPKKTIPALAKSDEQLTALLDDPDPIVVAAVEARLAAKSTIMETRIQKFLEAGAACNGMLPIPIRYYGGHTGRDSGEQYNPQNLPRIARNKDGSVKPAITNALRLSMRAPAGYAVVVADKSGIELRVNHFLWKVASSMRLYQQDVEADLYKAFAAERYGVEPAQVTKDQRQLAKVAQLGLGFRAGAKTFQRVARTMGGLKLTEAEALAVVTSWRNTYRDIVKGWERCDTALTYIHAGKERSVDPWGLTVTTKDGILLPSGRMLRYPDLRLHQTDDGKTSWVYGHGRHMRFTHGGTITENMVQAIAADIIMDDLEAMWRATGRLPALRVHDELVYVVPEKDAQDTLNTLQGIMRTAPTWWSDLILWSEGDIAPAYGLAK